MKIGAKQKPSLLSEEEAKVWDFYVSVDLPVAQLQPPEYKNFCYAYGQTVCDACAPAVCPHVF
jgi:hypothetical protein